MRRTRVSSWSCCPAPVTEMACRKAFGSGRRGSRRWTADQSFRVGLIYGPSGCGKSSLVKAGLLPRLAEHVVPVFVEATPADTEMRLLRGLRKACEALPPNAGLVETLTAVRRGQGLPAGRKLVIVLDQFEQWLHAHQGEENPVLVQALRQCDGARLQCIVMVRVDFWLAVNRFMRDLEIRLAEAENSHLVDLFDPRHARSVLIRFGQAFAALPLESNAFTPQHERFLDDVVSSLSVSGKVVSVCLTLFAEMVKSKPWTPATLQEFGGTTGIGVTFLEETFGDRTAAVGDRFQQQAARAVLQALLPDPGSDIKGGMRSEDELLHATGYTAQRREFAELLNLLDTQLRLITATDPEGQGGDEEHHSSRGASDRYYQLTHDYLVPSLRQWLAQKQTETRRGRAEICLADRSGMWNAKPERARLPTSWEFLRILTLIPRRSWTNPQRRMMSAASQYFAICILAFAMLAGLSAWGAYEAYGSFRASALIDSLVKAGPENVLETVDELQQYLPWARNDSAAASSD